MQFSGACSQICPNLVMFRSNVSIHICEYYFKNRSIYPTNSLNLQALKLHKFHFHPSIKNIMKRNQRFSMENHKSFAILIFSAILVLSTFYQLFHSTLLKPSCIAENLHFFLCFKTLTGLLNFFSVCIQLLSQPQRLFCKQRSWFISSRRSFEDLPLKIDAFNYE